MCMIDDGEVMQAWSQREIKRCRKQAKCYECGRAVMVGEPYRKYSGVLRGEGWQTYRVCQHCGVGCDWLVDTCSGFLHGGVEEDLREHAREYRRMDLYRFCVGMGHGWKRKDGRMMPIQRAIKPIEVPV